MDEEVAALLPARTGHFRLESGHHGDLWLELELLCFRTGPVRTLARELGRRVAQHDVEIICGPLVEGAFVALMVAEELGLPFTYSEPQRSGTALGLFPVTYRIPGVLRSRVGGRRVAVLNDVINAGSAVQGTLDDLRACGARPAAIGALAVLGAPAGRLAAEHCVPLERLWERPNNVWAPSECPLCARGVPLSLCRTPTRSSRTVGRLP